jgi:ABC-2 type transport system permease protein
VRAANVLHLGVKELRALLREPMLIALVVYVFTVAIYIAATAMPETLNRAALAIVDEDRSQLSMRIVDAFYPPHFVPPPIITQQEMDRRMDAGLDTFALNIPPGFERDLLAGRSPVLQLNVDATRMSQAFVGSGYIQAIISQEVQGFLGGAAGKEGTAVDLVLRSRFNPELSKSWFGAITELIDVVTMLCVILTGAAFIREREHGTLEHLLSMPVTPLEIMLSKIWSMGLVVLTGTWLSMELVVQGVLSVPVQGSIGLFLGGAALHLFATTCMGIFLATVSRSMPQFALLLMLVLVPLQVLSGGMTPQESMPDEVRFVMSGAPNTHYVALAQAVLFRGAGMDVVWPQFLALALIGGVLFLLSLAQFRRSLARTG